MHFRGHIDDARQLEKEDRLPDAAEIYQKIVDRDPGNQAAVGRLLVIYRKLKEYKKEISVINGAIAARCLSGTIFWGKAGRRLRISSPGCRR